MLNAKINKKKKNDETRTALGREAIISDCWGLPAGRAEGTGRTGLLCSAESSFEGPD